MLRDRPQRADVRQKRLKQEITGRWGEHYVKRPKWIKQFEFSLRVTLAILALIVLLRVVM